MGLFKMFSKESKKDRAKREKEETTINETPTEHITQTEVEGKNRYQHLATAIQEVKQPEVKQLSMKELIQKEKEKIESLPINNNLGIEVTKHFRYSERYEEWEMREDDRDEPTPFYKLPKYIIKEQNEMYHHFTMNNLAQGIFDTDYQFTDAQIERFKELYDTKYMAYEQQAIIDLALCGFSKREVVSILKITWRDFDELLFKADKKMSKHIKNASAKYGLMESQPMPTKLTDVKKFNDIVKKWNKK